MEFRGALLLSLLSLSIALSASSETNKPSVPVCQNKCGDVNITYPFGIGAGCYLDAGFEIRCNYGFPTPKAFLGGGNIEVVEIFPGYLRAHYKYISYNCYDQTGPTNNFIAWVNLAPGGAFRFSDTRNKFTAIGCATLAYIDGKNGHDSHAYRSGCVSMCYSPESATNGSCSGLGCCQTSIPKDLLYFNVSFGGYNHSKHDVWKFNPCSYGMLIEQDSYDFTTSDLSGFDFYLKNNITGFPVVLDWAIRDATCSKAKLQSSYACRSTNSYCYDAANGPGYLCNCSRGYEGNPYLEDGCKDIDECLNPDLYACYGVCSNKPGGYDCTCKQGTQGNATTGPCSDIPEKFPLVAKLSVVIGASVILMLVVSCLAILKLQKRKYLREKDEYFKQNGGVLLYEKLRSKQVDTVRVFTEKELEKATNNFNKDRIIGNGGHGMVYKGVLENNKEVAIKKSKIVDENQKDEFVNEIIILSQTNHKSVVRLLGCCLEVDVPMLVYEFIPNGTLFDFLHGKTRRDQIPLDMRLEIAVDSAEALAYLHSSASPPIVHGDVKSLNILLDANFKAKVADFGASTLVPLDKDKFILFVQGTRGYLDPECLTTEKLTEKSDVYSFGVVILELITRRKALYSTAFNETKKLALSFISAMEQDKLRDILDDQIVEEGVMDVLRGVAELAMGCLRDKRDDRPTMKKVADELRALLERLKHHPCVQKKQEEETKILHGEMSADATESDTTTSITGDSKLVLNIEGGR